MARLFSSNSVAYVDSRFVERLYILASGARDLSRDDKSFDAKLEPDVGIGIKTFLGGLGNSKREKIAEFTQFAKRGEFDGLSPRDLAHKVSSFRNGRVMSDARELGVEIENSIYHCLVRIEGGAVIHEEPYQLIELDSLVATTRSGVSLKEWPDSSTGMYFTDGKSKYNYSTAKNVLLKEFSFNRERELIELNIDEDIFDKILIFSGRSGATTPVSVSSDSGESLLRVDIPDQIVPGVDYVILPLYSRRHGAKKVAPKSGINQWNAGGRKRTFGEAYIPIPIEIHRLCPAFFPGRDESFDLQLPDRSVAVRGKVCQDDSKALMTDPNKLLGHWILKVVDPMRIESDFERPPRGQRPYTYSDLVNIGKDSVRVSRQKFGENFKYYIDFSEIGSYEEFVNLVEI